MNKFVPLHIVSGYSFLQSGLTIERIGAAIKKNDYLGAGLADKDVMYGIPSFIKMMEQINKPFIIGIDASFQNDALVLYAINEEGYKNLVAINTLIQKETIDEKGLEQHKNGIIAVLETNHGYFKNAFIEDKESTFFKKYLYGLFKIFDDKFYLGIEITSKEEKDYADKVRQFADKYNYPLVAFPRIKYLKRDDAIVLSIVEAIDHNEKLTIKNKVGNEYFLIESDYHRIYKEEEIANTNKILNASNFSYHLKRGEMLHYPCQESKQLLKDKCYSALKKLQINDDNHIKRLEYELDIINKMGYPNYFLVVEDYVKYAKENNILVGAGRGSAAGSLVSYLLNITEVDPLKYNLQFERFLNPFRTSMPDIDVDFMDIRRDEVVEYMRSKYGKEKVANIVTFQTILARQALRDIGRVYNYSDGHISLLCKRLTNYKYSLRESYKYLPEFKKIVDSDKHFLEIVSLASKIEGLPRQSGLHAAGIILNNNPLEDAIPISIDFNGNYISQYEMSFLEEQGFLKMDFLGLRNLTTIVRAVELINQNNKGLNFSINNIPYDEESVYKLIASTYTMGVFQLESSGMKNAIKILKPNCFTDIVAILALFRPGPMDSIKIYANRKEGKEKITYLDPCLEDILKETYGIIVYQEQINSIATVMAGFSLGEADMFRRAVSKKDKAKLASLQQQFILGSIKQGHTEITAKRVFEQIYKFADYGFNKSHSVVYSILACRMAYLKVHFPLEFYAAILETSSSVNDSKFNEYVSEMKQRNIAILPPNINESSKLFIIKGRALLFPLSAIHGVNDLFVTNLINERNENGPFKDYFDLAIRMYPYKISEAILNALIDAGALDCLYPSRASMKLSAKCAVQFASLNYNDNGQMNLGISPLMTPNMLPEVDDPLENLDLEYQAIGIMLSNNPLHYKKDLLMAQNIESIVEVNDSKSTYESKICGIIKSKKVINTKKSGLPMAFIKIFDETGEIEIIVFQDLYGQNINILEKNNIIVVKGRFTRKNNDEEYAYVATNINLLEE